MISWIGIGKNYAVQFCTCGLHLPLTPMTLDTFQTRILRQHCLLFTRVCGLYHHPALANSGNMSGHPGLVASHPCSVLLEAFHQSNFAILAIFPYTVAAFVF